VANERKAAIDLESIESTPLKSLSAVDFVAALSGAGAIGIHAMRFWPEKKKYELLTEPENLGNATIGGIFKGVREKKKIELEKDPRTEVFQKHQAAEFEWVNPQDLVINPAFREAVTVIAREVVNQLGRR
jgi:hypothetical protein